MKPTYSNLSRSILAGAAISTIVLAGSLQAAVTFDVTDIGPARIDTNPPSTTLAGASVTSNAISNLNPFPGPVTYTLTNVDFTSIGGTATEQIDFTVTFSVSSGGVDQLTNGNGFLYNTAGTGPNAIEPGEDLTATLSLTSTTFSGGLANLSAGFTGTSLGGLGPNGETWDIVYDGGTQAGSLALTTGNQVIPSSSFFTINNIGAATAPAGVSLRGYTVGINAVPEPSAALLGVLGLLALLRRRR